MSQRGPNESDFLNESGPECIQGRLIHSGGPECAFRNLNDFLRGWMDLGWCTF
jgi:hypothetical protein